MPYVVSIFLAYLLGSIPSAYLLVKWKSKADIRTLGSGNVGTLNAMEVTSSRRIGIAVLFADLFKGILVVAMIMVLYGNNFQLIAFGSIAAILGHDFPVWLKFKGGRGLAPTAGIMFVIAWVFVAIWGILWGISYAASRNVHVGNILASILSPVVVVALPASILRSLVPGFTPSGGLFFLSAILCLLIILQHRAPILEMLRGRQLT